MIKYMYMIHSTYVNFTKKSRIVCKPLVAYNFFEPTLHTTCRIQLDESCATGIRWGAIASLIHVLKYLVGWLCLRSYRQRAEVI